MKHAYLILAHHEFEVLKSLVKALDDERNDIYIHFDKKSNVLPELATKYAGLIIVENRIDVRWGDVSVIEAEYSLFETAMVQGIYTYYHLLSGVDMPIKSQDYIHDFFDQHQGKEFIGYNNQVTLGEIDRKVQRYYLFPKYFRESEGIVGFYRRAIRSFFLHLQLLFGIRRNTEITFRKGTQWISITNSLVNYLIQNKNKVSKDYSRTFCSDEIFVQTLCWNSSFQEKIFDVDDEKKGCMRMIGWEDNQIRAWKNTDFEKIMNSPALFARKFSGNHIDAVDRILNKIGSDV